MTGYKTFGGVQIGPTATGGDSVTAKIDRDFARLLNHVIHLARDLSAATDTALARLGNASLRVCLLAYQREHQEAIDELAELIVDLGHSPAKHGDFRSVIERGRVVVGQREGDHGILEAMLANEEALRDACRDVLGHSRLPPALSKALHRVLRQEDEHLEAYAKLISKFPVEPAPGPDEDQGPMKITYE